MSYQIADEPQESSLSAYVVRPDAPLLAMMLCGAWLAWPWFAFNSVALGSPTKRKEIGLCATAVAGTALLAAITIALWRAGVLRGTSLRFALLGITTWKLTLAYYVCAIQSRTFHVYEYYGGVVRQSRAVIGAGTYLRSLVLGISDNPVWIIIVAGLTFQGVVMSLSSHPLWAILVGGGL
ncbi:MAG: hypothetical protein SFX73_02885 [Kofleriaceae bacterium]|nr:hypothetical protein [Kofleriaceae bacterium]